jgi:hypothetical protein
MDFEVSITYVHFWDEGTALFRVFTLRNTVNYHNACDCLDRI